MPKNLVGGTNIAYLLKTGKSLRKTGSDIKPISHGKRKTRRTRSQLHISSSNNYELNITLKGVEHLDDVVQRGKFTTQSFIISNQIKLITTPVKIDERLNDILTELNKITGVTYTKEDGILWDKIELLRSNPLISDIIKYPMRYKFLKTKIRLSTVPGEFALLEITK